MPHCIHGIALFSPFTITAIYMFVHATHESDLCAYSQIVQLVRGSSSWSTVPTSFPNITSNWVLPWLKSQLEKQSSLRHAIAQYSEESGVFLLRREPHTSQSLGRLPNYQFHTQKICPKFSLMSRQSRVNTSCTQGEQAGTSLRKKSPVYSFLCKGSCQLLLTASSVGKEGEAVGCQTLGFQIKPETQTIL